MRHWQSKSAHNDLKADVNLMSFYQTPDLEVDACDKNFLNDVIVQSAFGRDNCNFICFDDEPNFEGDCVN